MIRVLITVVACLAFLQPCLADQTQPNILFISIDDLNDWPQFMGVYPDAKTPHMDKLAARGMVFTKAHAQYPICGPSRASIFSGMLTTTLGYTSHPKDAEVDERAKELGSKLLHNYFRDEGYLTFAVGKVMHRHVPKGSVDQSGGRGDWGHLPKGRRLVWKGNLKRTTGRDDVPTSLGTQTDWGEHPGPDENMSDHKAAAWAVDRLNEKHDKPFLLMVGFLKPHVPWFASKKWLDQYPEKEKLARPPYKTDDLDDIPARSRELNVQHLRFPQTQWAIENNQWQNLIQAYLACTTFVDDKVGRVLAALEASPYKDNTIVVLWSDHGYHLGEKGTIQKHTLWERSSHVPLIIAGPGLKPAQRCDRVVSLLDMYPTLLDMCGLPENAKNEGRSLVPLLKDPAQAWDFPALTSWKGDNHAVQTQRYRYIRYDDGSEELYDHQIDPNEWTNLADDKAHAATGDRLKKNLPVYDPALEQKPPSPLSTGLKISGDFPAVEELPVRHGMPDPFVKPDGSRVSSTKEWPAQRLYLKAMLGHYLYGSMPPRPKQFDLKRIWGKPVFGGKAIHDRYAITLSRNQKSTTFRFELIRPGEGKRAPGIIKNCRTFFETEQEDVRSRVIAEFDSSAAMEAVSRGYFLCKFNRNEVAADKPDNRDTGVFPLYPEYDWGTIAAWAWANGVVIDALKKLELVDMKRIVVTGHSRGGKTALCAGIYDERIAVTAPNSSGTGGTGSLRYFEDGQKPQRLILHKTKFPHWWVSRFFEFGGKENRLPFDAHTAKALIAPRALINAHARQDYWANPYGTELTYRSADKVFQWLEAKEQQGIHWRDGKHAQGKEDWLALLDFADWKFFNKKSERSFSTLAYPDAKLPINWNVPRISQNHSTEGQQDAAVNADKPRD